MFSSVRAQIWQIVERESCVSQEIERYFGRSPNKNVNYKLATLRWLHSISCWWFLLRGSIFSSIWNQSLEKSTKEICYIQRIRELILYSDRCFRTLEGIGGRGRGGEYGDRLPAGGEGEGWRPLSQTRLYSASDTFQIFIKATDFFYEIFVMLSPCSVKFYSSRASNLWF